MAIVEQLNTALAGRYVIDRELGSGGMATVYLAHDVRHDRPVALKVLNPELGAVLGATRFFAEIRVTANLHHPNLLPLFDSGEADNLLFYVMPYVDGESLRSKLAREKQLPVDEVVHIAAAVASALEYAHTHGVVHRDLKPENILLQAGQPMVADFGIALAVTRAGGERITQSGISLGTPQYMSPEQAAGDRVVDGRSDIYSLAAIAYEMFTGDPPYTGATVQSILAKVLTEHVPSVRRTRPHVPEHIDSAIARGLEKVPADRWHTAREFRDAITVGKEVASTDVSPLAWRGSSGTRSRRRGMLVGAAWVVIGIGVGMIVRTVFSALPGSSRRASLAWFDLALPDSIAPSPQFGLPIGSSIALSRDGSVVAYVGGATRSLFVRPIDELAARRLEGTQDAECPSFSPDGRWIVFTSRGVLKKVAARGGSLTVIANAGYCAVWTDRNEIIFDRGAQLLRIPADGGSVSLVAPLDTSVRIGLVVPSQALPGGKSVLIHVSDVGLNWQLGVVTLPGGRITKLASRTGTVRYAPRYSRGFLLFADKQSVVAAPFSLRTLRATGPEVTLLQDTIREFSTADNGSLAYVSGRSTFSLVAVSEQGATRTLVGDPETSRLPSFAVIPLDTAYIGWPRLSPDGKRVAVEMKTGPYTWDVWVYDLLSRTATRLTTNFTGVRPAGWADSRSVIFQTIDSGGFAGPRRIVSQPWDGSAPPEELIRLPVRAHDISMGPPRGYAAFSHDNDVWIAPLDTPQAARALVATAAIESHVRISRDGRLVAYISNESGVDEVYVRSVLGPTRRIQVSARGGVEPVWSGSGRQLYYRGPEYVMRATVTTDPELRVTRRDTLFRDVFERESAADYDVFPNGKELLMIRRNSGKLDAAVVLNWTELLHQRAVQRE